MKIKDEKYLKWIRKQSCCLCSHKAGGRFFTSRDTKITPQKCRWARRLNAAHHVGDGKSSPRFNDHCVVPLCDLYCDFKAVNNCHHLVHQSVKKYRRLLQHIALLYRQHYLKEKS